MKRFIIATLVLGIALLGLQAQASANLLDNPGFDDPTSYPWETWSEGDTVLINEASTDESRSPSKSLNLQFLGTGTASGDYGTCFQVLDPSDYSIGDTLFGHGYLKGNVDANAFGAAYFGFWDTTHTKLSWKESGHFKASAIPDWYKIPEFSTVVPATVGGKPLGTVEFGFKIVAEGPNSTTNLYFDDGYVVPEPATMLLFGSGLVGLLGFSRRKRS